MKLNEDQMIERIKIIRKQYEVGESYIEAVLVAGKIDDEDKYRIQFIIRKSLETADQIPDDLYKSSILLSVVSLLCKGWDFKKADYLINYINYPTAKKTAQDKLSTARRNYIEYFLDDTKSHKVVDLIKEDLFNVDGFEDILRPTSFYQTAGDYSINGDNDKIARQKTASISSLEKLDRKNAHLNNGDTIKHVPMKKNSRFENLGSTVMIFMGILLWLSFLNSIEKGQDSNAGLSGTVLILVGIAYKSAKNRILYGTNHPNLRLLFEVFLLLISASSIFLLKDLKYQIATNPFPVIIIPAYALSTYIFACFSNRIFAKKTDTASNITSIEFQVQDSQNSDDADQKSYLSEGSAAKNPDQKRITPKNFFLKYWYGEISLPISYWLIGFSVNIFTTFLIFLTQAYFQSLKSFNPILLLISSIILWISLLSLLLWQLVGLWRSAGFYIANPIKSSSWGYLARLMILIGFMRIIEAIFSTALPQIEEMVQIVFNNDPTIPNYRITLSENGTEIKIQGGIKWGITNDFNKIISAAPAVTTVDLESIGGRIGEAKELYDSIKDKNLNTVTNGQCLSACTIPFAAGKNRWLGYKAKLGFHSGIFAGLSEKDVNDSNTNINEDISYRIKVPKEFWEKVNSVANKDMWYPSRDELLRYNYISSKSLEASSSKTIVETALNKSFEGENKKLPKKIDDATTLIKMAAFNDTVIYYNLVSDETLNDLVKNQQRFFKIIQAGICENKDIKDDLDNGIIYSYYYFMEGKPKDGTFIKVDNCDNTTINNNSEHNLNSNQLDANKKISSSNEELFFSDKQLNQQNEDKYTNENKEILDARDNYNKCYEEYNSKVEAAKDLIGSDGSMYKFAVRLKQLRFKYFEPRPNDMVYNQKLVDVWKAFDNKEVTLEYALEFSKKAMEEYNKEPQDPRFPLKMKPCANNTKN